MDLRDQLLLLAAVSYFIGAIPFGLVIGAAKGLDIRQHGSRNIGASNAGRVLGRRYFWIVFGLDLLKSFVPMLVASWLVHGVAEEHRTPALYAIWLGVGVAASVGHIFPVYLRFRGGKGVATSAGVVLGLFPYFSFAGVLTLLVYVVTLKASRYISLSSMAASVSFPLLYLTIGLMRGWPVFGTQWPLLAMAVGLSALVVLRHRSNITRLLNGTESKVGLRVTPPSAAES